MENIFRRLGAQEVSEGYRLIVERTDWLNQKGIRQWNEPIPEAVIRERQAAGKFFGYWAGDNLMAVVCLLEDGAPTWGTHLHGRYQYLATLASSLAHAGQGYGSQCALAACEHGRRAGFERIYLDCVDNGRALPTFYLQLGFGQIAASTEPDGRQVVLMVKEI